ncbi:hypothetical protein GOODEAATRI_001148 [Goodea atripinnis]|uniref:Uncharacterized protein n=1 Tax=Goodea atripinnis TaxID=208336 RepID=A0ABV0P0F4_9TELE
MKGMVERPIAVVVHLRTGRGHLVVLPSRYRDAAHTRLIVKPGMITEARACHTNVSTTATATRVVFPGFSGYGIAAPNEAHWHQSTEGLPDFIGIACGNTNGNIKRPVSYRKWCCKVRLH